jgi:hypothetical protein
MAAELTKAQREGRALAQELLSLRPAEDSTNTGVLTMRNAKNKRTEVPVSIATTLTATNWQILYATTGTNKDHAATVAIVRSGASPNEYRRFRLSPEPGDAAEFDRLTGDKAFAAFAGSDFWLCDLGMEFLHWPEQRIVKTEMRKGESCRVLESVNPQPAPGAYSRVVSWVDIDTGGIVHADAYDHRGKLLKEFDPKKFKKVNGKYELKSMEMRNEQTDTRTTIEFDLDVK